MSALGDSGLRKTLKWGKRNALVVLLLAGYGVMLLLNVQQDRTIARQRELIHSLLGDSIELSAIKMQRAQTKESHPDAAARPF